MGCDYYIVTYLCVKTTNNNYNINLTRDNGYFHDSYEFDSDEDDYDDKIQKEYEKQMENCKKPAKLIFENGKYINKTCEEKYKNIIEIYFDVVLRDKLLFEYYDIEEESKSQKKIEHNIPNSSDIISIWKKISVFERG